MNAFVGRMRSYLQEMFPVPLYLLVSVLLYASVALYARHVHDLSTSLISQYGAIGVWSVFNIMLILRLMDELKDEDIDLRLFPDRPLPSGRVRRSDIQWSLLVASVLYLGVNLWAGWVFYVAVGVLAYAFLMFHRFFAPALLGRNLPVTLATHCPVTVLILLHGFAVFAAENSLDPGQLRWKLIVPFILMVWATFIAWELARKIRVPDEEDEYVTYSQIFGSRGAIFVTWAVQAISLCIAVYLCLKLDLQWTYPTVVLVGAAVSLWGGVRFLRYPSPKTSKIKPFAAAFVIAVLVSQIVGFG